MLDSSITEGGVALSEISELSGEPSEGQPDLPQEQPQQDGPSRGQFLGLKEIIRFVESLKSRQSPHVDSTSHENADKASPQEPLQTVQKPTGMTRRRFLRNLTLVGAAGMTANFWSMYQSLGKTLGEVASNRGSLNVLINALSFTFKRAGHREAKATYGVDLQENPHYRPMLSIINEAVNTYIDRTHKSVTYIFHPERNDDKYYDTVIQGELD